MILMGLLGFSKIDFRKFAPETRKKRGSMIFLHFFVIEIRVKADNSDKSKLQTKSQKKFGGPSLKSQLESRIIENETADNLQVTNQMPAFQNNAV